MFNLDKFIADSVTFRPVSMFAPDIEANKEKLMEEIKGKKVCVIGGAGSIGSSFIKAVGFEGTVEFDASKPDGTMRKLIDVSKLHSLGWTHKVEIEDGVARLFAWYKSSLD